jgi:hypothetical protein
MDLEFNLLAAEQTNSTIQRLFVTSGYDIIVCLRNFIFQNFSHFYDRLST